MVVAAANERLLVTVAEAAKMLSLSRRTLWRLTKAGKLPAVRYGRAVRYSVDELRRHIQEHAKASGGK
jgi:excisionase family DNA binding protein